MCFFLKNNINNSKENGNKCKYDILIFSPFIRRVNVTHNSINTHIKYIVRVLVAKKQCHSHFLCTSNYFVFSKIPIAPIYDVNKSRSSQKN